LKTTDRVSPWTVRVPSERDEGSVFTRPTATQG
jgi:hypothetical protein